MLLSCVISSLFWNSLCSYDYPEKVQRMPNVVKLQCCKNNIDHTVLAEKVYFSKTTVISTLHRFGPVLSCISVLICIHRHKYITYINPYRVVILLSRFFVIHKGVFHNARWIYSVLTLQSLTTAKACKIVPSKVALMRFLRWLNTSKTFFFATLISCMSLALRLQVRGLLRFIISLLGTLTKSGVVCYFYSRCVFLRFLLFGGSGITFILASSNT